MEICAFFLSLRQRVYNSLNLYNFESGADINVRSSSVYSHCICESSTQHPLYQTCTKQHVLNERCHSWLFPSFLAIPFILV